MTRLACVLVLLLPSLALAAEPKAVVTGPPRVATGNVIFLDASQSVSDRPLIWKPIVKAGQPAPTLITFDKDGRKGVFALIPNAPDGEHAFALIAVGTPTGKTELEFAIEVVQVTVGQLSPVRPDPTPAPGPTPNPTPTPGPLPTDKTERLGYDYAKALTGAADSALDAAARGRYDSTEDLAKAQRKAFTDALTTAFRPVGEELVRSVGEPSPQASARDVAAVQDYLKKIQAGVRAAK